MVVSTKLVMVHYDMHEPYNYARLWEILRAEGLQNRILAEDGTWSKLPDSMWQMEAPGGDAIAARHDISERLRTAVGIAGLRVDLFVLVCEGWAWRSIPAKPAPVTMMEAFGAGLFNPFAQ